MYIHAFSYKKTVNKKKNYVKAFDYQFYSIVITFYKIKYL